MTTYMIGYDLNREGDNYAAKNKALTDRIKEISGTWWHHLDSTWLVVTNWTAVDIRDHLCELLDDNDELLVCTASPDAAWHGFNTRGHRWLVNYL